MLLAIRHIFRFSGSHFKSLAQVPMVVRSEPRGGVVQPKPVVPQIDPGEEAVTRMCCVTGLSCSYPNHSVSDLGVGSGHPRDLPPNFRFCNESPTRGQGYG
jgi:hypothetical protein